MDKIKALKDKLGKKAMSLDSIIRLVKEACDANGGSDISMTAATEAIWGTSGRGSQGAKNELRWAVNHGALAITRVGRTERVNVTLLGVQWCEAFPSSTKMYSDANDPEYKQTCDFWGV